MEEGLDTGPIAMAEKLAITPDMTAGEAHDRLSILGADLIGRALAALERGALKFQAAGGRGRGLREKDRQGGGAHRLFPVPRGKRIISFAACRPFPAPFSRADFGKGAGAGQAFARTSLAMARENRGKSSMRRRASLAATARLTLVEVQRAGRGPVSGAEFLRGARLASRLLLTARSMPRYKLVIEYDGTDYVGWQRQANGLSVQEVIERALSALDPGPIGLRGAGRTDAGVHATAQSRPCRSVARMAHGQVARRGQRPHAAGKGRRPRGRGCFRRFRRALFRQGAALSLSHRQPPRAADFRQAARLAGQAPARCARRCTRRRNSCSASTISRPSAIPIARRKARCARWTGSTSFARARKSTSTPALAPFCTVRCAPWSARWSMSARANGRRRSLRAALDARDRARCGQVAPAAGLYLVGVDY